MMKNKFNFFSSCAVVSMIPSVLIQEIASAFIKFALYMVPLIFSQISQRAFLDIV